MLETDGRLGLVRGAPLHTAAFLEPGPGWEPRPDLWVSMLSGSTASPACLCLWFGSLARLWLWGTLDFGLWFSAIWLFSGHLLYSKWLGPAAEKLLIGMNLQASRVLTSIADEISLLEATSTPIHSAPAETASQCSPGVPTAATPCPSWRASRPGGLNAQALRLHLRCHCLLFRHHGVHQLEQVHTGFRARHGHSKGGVVRGKVFLF